MPFTVYLTYRICLRSKMRPKTKFFASWSIATTAYLFCIYQVLFLCKCLTHLMLLSKQNEAYYYFLT